MSFSMVCQGLRYLANAVTLADEVHEACTQDNANGKARAVLNAGAFALTTVGFGGEIAGCKENTLEKIAKAETIVRAFNFPVAASTAAIEYVDGKRTGIQAIEAGLITPAASLVRSAANENKHHYQHLLTLPPDQRVEPVYKYDGECWQHDYDRVLTEKECKEGAVAADNLVTTSSRVEMGAAAIRANKVYQDVVNQIAAQRQRRPAPGGAPLRPAAAPTQLAAAPPRPTAGTSNAAASATSATADPTDPLSVNLLSLPFIPEALHDDMVFSRYICPISLAPIRHAIRDPNGTTLYETAHIIQEIYNSGRSPITRQPLTLANLQPVPLVQQLIDQRLAFYQAQIQAAIQSGLVVPPPQNLQAWADAENPNY